MAIQEGLIKPEDWEAVQLPKDWEEIFKRYGLGAGVGVTTPTRIIARTIRIGYEYFYPIIPFKFARLADSNSDSAETLSLLLPPSSGPIVYEKVIGKERFLIFFEREKVIRIKVPGNLDYTAFQLGEAPTGFGGRLLFAAQMLPKVNSQLESIARDTENYFSTSKYGCGFRLEVRSLGGTEILNLASIAHQTVKPNIILNVWVVDQRHPNLLPLLSWRLLSIKERGLRENEAIILRVNGKNGRVIEGDVVLGKLLNGLVTRYGGPESFDFSTIMRKLTDRFGNILAYDYTTINVPVFPIEEGDRVKILFWELILHKKSIIRKTEESLKVITDGLGRLSSSESRSSYYVVIGSLTRGETEKVGDEAKKYFGRDSELLVVPCASELIKYGNYYFMKVSIVRFKSGFEELKGLYGEDAKDVRDVKEIPEETLEKIINDEKNRDIKNGLEMAAKYLNMDILDFVRGERK